MLPQKLNFLYVGQLGHVHNFVFSSVSGTAFPKTFTKTKFGRRLIIVCVCNQLATASKKIKDKVENSLMRVLAILSAFIVMPVPAYSQYIICPKCKSQVASNSNYCSFCGTFLKTLVLLKICPRCKNRIDASARFCPECGAIQQSANTTSGE